MSRRSHGSGVAAGSFEDGSVSVEFAAVLPVVAAVLALLVSAVLTAGVSVRLTVASAAVARALGRADHSAAQAAATSLAPDARIAVRHSGRVLCVDAVRSVRIGVLPPFPVTGTGCALDAGR